MMGVYSLYVFAVLFETIILQWEILVECTLGYFIAFLPFSSKSRHKVSFLELLVFFPKRTQWTVLVLVLLLSDSAVNHRDVSCVKRHLLHLISYCMIVSLGEGILI